MMRANHYGHILNIRTESDYLIAKAVIQTRGEDEADLVELTIYKTPVTVVELNELYMAISLRCKDLGYLILHLRTDDRTHLGALAAEETGKFCYAIKLWAA